MYRGSCDPKDAPLSHLSCCFQCQHFRDHYIAFAEQMNAVTAELKTPPVSFFAVSCTAHHKICRDMHINGFPRVLLFAAGDYRNQTADIKYWKLHPFDVLTEMGIQVSRKDVLPVVKSAENKDTAQLRQERLGQQFARSKEDMFSDAYLSFDFMMRNGVFTNQGSLTNNTKNALHDWLYLLRKTTPAVWELQPVLKDILRDFDRATLSEENLVAIMDKHPAPRKAWSSSCTKGIEGMGYTCGLWVLFHMMTVGVVEYNAMIGMTDDGLLGELSITTVQAAEVLRNVVANFFQCDYCRMNFLQSYDSCEHDRCSRLSETTHRFNQWIQLPVWLFETHNSVNARLVRERAEREKKTSASEQEVSLSQWPSKDACPVCWLEHGGWDETMVYKFLRMEYWYVRRKPPHLFSFFSLTDTIRLEDAVTAEHRALIAPRQTVVLEAPRFPYELFPIAAGLAGLACWYSKRSRFLETGKHKKTDNDEC